jgi:hypothetical protein
MKEGVGTTGTSGMTGTNEILAGTTEEKNHENE